MNKIVEQILRTMAVDVDSKWVKKLSFVEFAVNSSENTSMGKSPFELLYGQPVRLVADHLDGLHRNESAQILANKVTELVENTHSRLVKA